MTKEMNASAFNVPDSQWLENSSWGHFEWEWQEIILI